MNKKLLERISKLFEEKLQAKTSWGRNEVIGLYKDSVTEAMMELLD